MIYWKATENTDENINKNKSIERLMTRYIFLVTGHVETVCVDEIKKKMGDNKKFRGVVCLPLVFVAELVML